MAQSQSFNETGIGDSNNTVTVFQLENRAVRGRVVRLGTIADMILSAHQYPKSVARLVGEAVALAVLIGDSFKIDGKLIIQASGPGTQGQNVKGAGAVAFVVADYVPGEGVRAYAKYDLERVKTLEKVHKNLPGADMLIGAGNFVMTIDPGEGAERYQGITKITGSSLVDSAEHYFSQSEQVPTRIRVALGEYTVDGAHSAWRLGGALIQRIASDDVRGQTDEDFNHARALFETVSDDELVDTHLTTEHLLYRLFHEDGVRVESSRSVARRCICNAENLISMLVQFPSDDLAHMTRDDGSISMTCEYCNFDWRFTAHDIDHASRAND